MQQRGAVHSDHDRLAALEHLIAPDAEPEPEFDELVQIAAAICGVPICLVSLVDQDHVWIKASVGIDEVQSPREHSFCTHAIQQTGMLMVEDAAQDLRFRHNPNVLKEHGIRFYAGVPISTPDGAKVGTLCVVDSKPRSLTSEQSATLRLLAAHVNTRLELRLRRRQMEQALAEAERARTHLAASEQRFQTFMDSGPFMSYLKDAEGHLLYYNQLVADHFDISRTFLLGKTDAEIWPAALAESYRQHDLSVLSSGTLCVADEQLQSPDGTLSTWRSYKFPCTDGDGHTLLGGFSIDLTDIQHRQAELEHYQQQLEAANRHLSDLASLDGLTGLPNRRLFDEQLRQKFRQARRSGMPLALLLLDVDRFKSHNDRFGHAHGDEVLRELGQCLKSELRQGDLLARYGGEEFAILLPETDETSALVLANRLQDAVRGAPWPNAAVTVSMGLSMISPATPDTQRLLTLADEALYAAKRAGRDRIVPYSQVYGEAIARAQDTRRPREANPESGVAS